MAIDSRAQATSAAVNLIVQNDSPDAAAHVVEGARIEAIYIELWVLAGSQQPGSITVTVEKAISGLPSPTFIEMATLDTYANKKNIFYTTQGLTPDANGNPVPFIRQWFKIPKGKQRWGREDKLKLNISANVEDCTFCGLAIFKAQT